MAETQQQIEAAETARRFDLGQSAAAIMEALCFPDGITDEALVDPPPLARSIAKLVESDSDTAVGFAAQLKARRQNSV